MMRMDRYPSMFALTAAVNASEPGTAPAKEPTRVVVSPLVTVGVPLIETAPLIGWVAGKLPTLTVPLTVCVDAWFVTLTGMGLAGALTTTTCWNGEAAPATV